MDSKKDSVNIIKLILIVLAMATVWIAVGNGPVLSDGKESISLVDFKSFYAWSVMVSISLWLVLIKKNANITIGLSILTYIWTWYVVNDLVVKFPQAKLTIGMSFYIFLSSALFLIISLFFNNKKKDVKAETSQQELSNALNNNFDENNLIFTNYINGIKGMPINTPILLVNNISDNTFDLIYNLSNNENDSKTIKYPRGTIKNITYDTRIKMQNANKKVEENESKSVLLSAVMLGGTPLLQFMGNSGFEFLFNSLSNNYDKVNYNAYYEITIETIINNQEDKLVISTETNPEEFINRIIK